jgi:toxin CptA
MRALWIGAGALRIGAGEHKVRPYAVLALCVPWYYALPMMQKRHAFDGLALPRAVAPLRSAAETALPLWLLLVWLCALPPLWLSLTAAPAVRVEVGQWGDHTALAGMNGIEQAAQEDYRWTTERVVLTLPNLSGRYELLQMRAHGWRPDGLPSPAVRLDIAGQPWGTLATTPDLRVYHMLLPHDPTGASLQVGFSSEVYNPPGDPRQIGFALDWLALTAIGRADGPNLWQVGGQGLLLALTLLLIAALGLPAAPSLIAAVAVGVGVVGANMWQPLWVCWRLRISLGRA